MENFAGCIQFEAFEVDTLNFGSALSSCRSEFISELFYGTGYRQETVHVRVVVVQLK